MFSGGRGVLPGGGPGGNAAAARLVGTLKVVATQMRPGYLRKKGVPYSDRAVLTEYFDRTDEPSGESYLVVTVIVEDPTYLNQKFITSSHFGKQNDASGWNPTACFTR